MGTVRFGDVCQAAVVIGRSLVRAWDIIAAVMAAALQDIIRVTLVDHCAHATMLNGVDIPCVATLT